LLRSCPPSLRDYGRQATRNDGINTIKTFQMTPAVL
jgi:hypothetical protein